MIRICTDLQLTLLIRNMLKYVLRVLSVQCEVFLKNVFEVLTHIRFTEDAEDPPQVSSRLLQQITGVINNW